MSVEHSIRPLEQLLRDCGLGWMIDWYAPPEKAVSALLDVLRDASEESRSRFGENAVEFSEQMLVSEHGRNPHKVEAFLQALASVRTPQMLVMCWRVLQGAEIRSVTLNYECRGEFAFQVTLGSEEAPNDVYQSTDVHDAQLMRHLGIASVNGRPLFDGFYPLQLG